MSWSHFTSLLVKEGYSSADSFFIERAFIFAEKAHAKQKRSSGDPFMTHCIATAEHTVRLHMDAKTIAAALLHDTIEDCSVSVKTLEEQFGADVAFLVEGVTKVSHVRHKGTQRHLESLRKMFLAVAEDVRVVIIKLADRLHNMETIQFVRPEKQGRIALETLEIYAPIAYRLGIWDIKSRLEDLAFPIVYPDEYNMTRNFVEERVSEGRAYLENHVKPFLEKELAEERIHFSSIGTREKNLYSTWKKAVSYDMDFDRITDLLAVRIIVSTIEDCYRVLGIIHVYWKPLPGRIKDYIALPKPNGYRSLHTTVFCINNAITEFQIRTRAMHEEAEHGIAAHWAYTESGKPKGGGSVTHATTWIQDLREWQNTIDPTDDGETLLELLKIDFFRDRIFILTPKGEAIDLPAGATPIDFAYRIHTDIGNHMIGAKINGKMAPFSAELVSGDTVEILTQKKRKPSSEWLSLVKTSLARTQIRTALRREPDTTPSPIRILPDEHPLRHLHITARNHVGLLNDISRVFTHFRIHIQNISMNTNNKSFPIFVVSFRPRDKKQLQHVITRLKTITEIQTVSVRDKE